MNYTKTNNEERNLFMTNYNTNGVLGDIWFIESGCSNHMSGANEILKELDQMQKMKVKLGDDKDLQAQGNDTVAI